MFDIVVVKVKVSLGAASLGPVCALAKKLHIAQHLLFYVRVENRCTWSCLKRRIISSCDVRIRWLIQEAGVVGLIQRRIT